MAFNETELYDELNSNNSVNEVEKEEVVYLNLIRALYIVTYITICFLGLLFNFYVVITSCCVYYKTQKSATSVYVLALALTHLVFSAFLVLQFLYAWYYFNWHYGQVLCKFSSYIFYTSMFSTAAVLSLWSISSCISSSRCAEVLCTKCGSTGTSIFLVLSSWALGMILGTPSLLSRELRYTKLGQQCIDDYDLDQDRTTETGRKILTAVVLGRFLLGVLVPMFMMGLSAILAGRQGGYSVHESCKRVICGIKVVYFVCWTPVLFLSLLQVTTSNSDFFKYGLPAATMLAAAHCFINPVICLLMGGNINMQWMSPVQGNTKTENMPLNTMQE